ncbi:MAG: TonB-dependent receptor [Candidatus Marinimicrobia bacterium]|nr:TonB-dependent receptor [Candidatus Neomarinimicrobiota bacterium]
MSTDSHRYLRQVTGDLARNRLSLLFHTLLACLLMSVPGSNLKGGTTGKITGLVQDVLTDEGLAGANVIIEGTYLGASTDADGRYVILNIPPGIYNVQVSMMGYAAVRTSGVRVSVDFTTEVDFQLGQTVLQLEALSVIATRPIVQKDRTSTLAIVSSEELADMPVEEFADVLALQAGIVTGAGGEIHMRGGRASEISYLVDGLSVTDPFSGEIGIVIENSSIQELQVISGTFNAEYGQAMSGIVEIVTKEGRDKFQGNVSFYAGDYLSNATETFLNIGSVTPRDITNVQLSLSGPVPLFRKKLTFFVTGRLYSTQGWLFGQERFLPADSSSFQNWNFRTDDVGRDGIPDTGDFGEADGGATPGEPNVYVEETGDSTFVAMSPFAKISTEGKLTYRISPSIKVSYSFFWDKSDFREYSHLFKLNPEGDYKRFKNGYVQAFNWNHSLSSRTFYTVKISNTFFNFQRYVYEDSLDARYVDPKRLSDASKNAFITGGSEMWHFNRTTRSWQGKLDLTSQIHNAHLVKVGMGFRKHDLSFREFEIIPKRVEGIEIKPFEPAIAEPSSIVNNSYRHRPVEASAYIQDKMEFEDMIINIGLRYDYFNPNTIVPIDLRDPDNAKYFVVPLPDGGSRIVRDNEYSAAMGEIIETVNVRGQPWIDNYSDAKPVHNVSPRIGISYPISDRGAIHFSYGHFSQIPTFEHLYDNSEFEVWPGGLTSTMGNGELKPQRTVIYEVGLQQQVSNNIGIDVTGFYKDMRHLLGMQILTTYTQDVYARFINRDYGNIRGVTLALKKRRSGYLWAAVDYTYQVAEGNASDPLQVFYDAQSNTESEIQVVPLTWDQTHTFNFNITLSSPGSWGLSLIGRLGSGLPYTPKIENTGASFKNSERKPSQYTFDLKAHRGFNFIGGKYSVFIKAYNIFDRRNEILIYSDTGRAGYTIEPRGSVRGVNTLQEFLTRPDFYSEPRRVLVGVSLGFDSADDRN